MANKNYTNNVFINCPFDNDYKPIFEAIIFAIFDCGYIPRCAKEFDDSSQVRIDKTYNLIRDSKYGIHDISRIELNPNKSPRFNMPLELGIFLGAKRYGVKEQKKKICLILDKVPYKYHESTSDISGQDIRPHKNQPNVAIKVIRNWLNAASKRTTIPGATEIIKRYTHFQKEFPVLCRDFKLTVDEVTYNDYATIVSLWLRQNP